MKKKIKQMTIQKSDGITECYVLNKDYRELEEQYNELLAELEKIRNKSEIAFYEKHGIRHFKYKSIEWAEFKKNEFVAVDILSIEIVDEIVEDKRYLDSGFDIIYNNDIFDSSWENSFVRKILNDKFKSNYLDNLSLDGEVRLLTKEEAENLPDDLKETSRYGYWTMSPYYFIATDSYAGVFLVSSNGQLDNNWVSSTYGVRPVIKVRKECL